MEESKDDVMMMMMTTTTMTPDLLEVLSRIDFEAWKTHVDWRTASEEN
jgi:hypothetical protein